MAPDPESQDRLRKHSRREPKWCPPHGARTKMIALLTAHAALTAAHLLPPANIEWQSSYEAALRAAADEKRVVFVAVDHAGEARSDRVLKILAKDKRLQALTQQTLNVPVSFQTHREKGNCPRFKGLSCTDHRRAGTSLLESVLQRNDKGMVAVPQYLWLNPQGEVLCSVAFEVEPEGLLWCFETTLRMLDVEETPPLSEEARPPRRLLMGRTLQLSPGDNNGRGMTPEELEVVLDETNRSFMGMANTGRILHIMFTDEEDAVDYVRIELNGVLKNYARDRLPDTLHAIGTISPASFWVTLEEFADSKGDAERHEVAVALEQLGAPDALRLVKRALKREKDKGVENAWIRALGACGATDKGTRRTLLKLARSGDEIARANAIFALGYLQRHEDIRALWNEVLSDGSPALAVSAACSAALARDEQAIPAVEAAIAAAEEKAPLERALAVLRGGDLFPIANDVAWVTRDDLRRERIFFAGPPTTEDDE
jgi:hypothetical protein